MSLPARTIAAIAFVAVAGIAGPASAAELVGQWPMTVVSGSADGVGGPITMQGVYSSVSGKVGSAIKFDFNSAASFGTVDTSAPFNPGTRNFAVSAYFTTPTVPSNAGYSPNIVQKGLYTSTGQWKMQLEATPGGTIAGCRFIGSGLPAGDLVNDGAGTRLDDGQWHRVTCWRVGGQYGITVDGTTTQRTRDLGNVSTSLPVRVGNKSAVAGVQDQFQGTLDCVAYADGSNPRPAAEAGVPC